MWLPSSGNGTTASHYPAGVPTLRPAFPKGKMRLTDFCNCNSRHEHLPERSTLEVSPALSRLRHARWSQSPSGQLEWPGD
jgi:hypothetical protein